MNQEIQILDDISLIPGILLYIMLAWILNTQNRKASKLEAKTLDIFIFATVYLALLPLHLLYGFLILGIAVIISPYLEAILNISISEFIKSHIWVDGHISSLIFTAVIGTLPSFIGFYQANKEDSTKE